jgi:cytochrome c553
MNRYRFLAGVAALGPVGFVTAMLHAQTQQDAQTQPPETWPGARIAAQGTMAGAPPCAQCHAFNGVSDASGAFPRLAGQSTSYLAQQLRDFASGVRTSALMTSIAKALSPEDIVDVSGYYASIDAPFLPLKPGDPELVRQGEQLAKVGSAERQIQACDNCHGPSGAGEPPAIPYLAGQYAHYIAFTLDMWRQGYRKNNPDFMAVIAKKLTDEDIAAVAAYYQQVHSPLETAESQSERLE